jgi:hypothetical protein
MMMIETPLPEWPEMDHAVCLDEGLSAHAVRMRMRRAVPGYREKERMRERAYQRRKWAAKKAARA